MTCEEKNGWENKCSNGELDLTNFAIGEVKDVPLYSVFHISTISPDFSGNHGNHKNWVPSMLTHWFLINLNKNQEKKYIFGSVGLIDAKDIDVAQPIWS